MNFNKLTSGEKVTAVTGTLLTLSLLVLPWHSSNIAGIVTVKRTGIQSPNSLLGLLALILAVLIVAAVLVPKFTKAELPKLPLPLTDALFFAGIAVVALLVLKYAMETTAIGFGAWISIVLGGLVAFGTFLIRQEAAGRSRSAPLE